MTWEGGSILKLERTEFRQGAFVLQANLSIKPGITTAVIGPSGAGKSTLLGGIAGFVTQTQGVILWKETRLSGAKPQLRPVSMLFQDHNLFPHLSVTQNVGLALAPRLKLTAEQRDNVDAMLLRVGLSGLGQRHPSDLSGGQQSRVALARALLQDRPILLLDEPFSALGPALKDEMLDLTLELAQNRAVVMITHDPKDALRIANEAIGVANGMAYAPLPIHDFLTAPPEALIGYFSQNQ